MIVGMSQSLLPKHTRSKRPLKLRLGLGPLLQLVVQNRTYKLRTQMTTQFPFWRMKISVIKKSKTLVMKPRITHNKFFILNQIWRGSLLPMKQSQNLPADTSPPLSPVTEETLYRRSVAFLLSRISRFWRWTHRSLTLCVRLIFPPTHLEPQRNFRKITKI